MKKMFPPWTFVALALSLAVCGSHRANAQQLAPDSISAADSAALHARQGEIDDAARIYGYHLEEGNWSYEQASCAAMPNTILLHYFRKFPDGAESLFTAAVPRGSGRVRIVPVLYRNATPFVPAPKNTRNYVLFNDLVPQAIARGNIAAGDNGLALAICYADLTGGRTSVPRHSSFVGAIAGEPQATIHRDAQGDTTLVTFAGNEGVRDYTIWSVSFNKNGRVISAESEDHSVYAPKVTPQVQPVVTASMPETNPTEQSPEENKETSSASVPPVVSPASASAPLTANPPSASAQASEPGWKVIPHPAEPVWNVMVVAPQPPEKIVPNPANGSNKPASEDQLPQ